MRRILALLAALALLALAGCSGDTSRAAIRLGPSQQFSATELQAAADAILSRFHEFDGCTLLRLSYDEDFSERQLSLTETPTGQAVVFTSDFEVDWTGASSGFNPNSTYTDWTWQVTRPDPDAPWEVTNWGVG